MIVRNVRKRLMVSLIALFLGGLNLRAETTKLHILQTSDIHSSTYLKDYNLFKMLTLLKKTQALYNKDKTLLIDTGDFIHGNFEASYSNGYSSLCLLKAFNFDITVVGNHELDYNLTDLKNNMKKLDVQLYAANITNKKNGELIFSNYKIFTKDGVKILVVPLTVPDNGLYDFTRDYKFENYDNAMKRITKELKEQKITADIYVLAVHDGFRNYSRNRVYSLLKKYPFFNIILGAHMHKLIPGEKTPNGGYYTQAGYHAQGFIDLTIDFDKKTRKILNVSSKFEAVKKDTPEDPALKKLFYDEFVKQFPECGRKTFASVNAEIKPDDIDLYNSTAVNLIGNALKEQIKTDYAIIGQLKKNATLKKGNINDFDLYMFFKYEDNCYKTHLNFNEYQTIINNLVKSKQKTLNIYGLKTIVNKKGKIIEDIILKDGSIWQQNPQKRISFATNRFALTNWRSKTFANIARSQKSKTTKEPIIVRKALKRFLQLQQNKSYHADKTKYLIVK
ncbi:metallophosphoesterase [Lentisphaerota bacterium WC36G]|nr:metallophosphoesterase [Lentisphaerae bacterium WC36]